MAKTDDEKKRRLRAAVRDIKVTFGSNLKSATKIWGHGAQKYREGLAHSLGSSDEEPMIVVEPSDANDTAKLLKIIAKHRVRFAIMGGGHATCPGFSSTTGIHIRMSCLNDLKFFKDRRLIRAGAGCTWDETYKAVDAKGRIIVGGASDRGVGIAGYLLGGGYSMKTNQYGLGVDNVTEFEVALPNGNVLIANEKKNKDLFEALRGGGNNFGIVTHFTIKTHLARKTYGASISYESTEANKVKAAILKFVKEQDQTRSIVAAFRHVLTRKGTVKYTIDVTCLWNGRITKKSGVSNVDNLFKDFKRIPGGDKRGLWKTRPLGWGRAEGGVVPLPRKTQPRLEASRGRFGCVMVFAVNKDIVNEVEKQAKRCAQLMKNNSGIMVMVDVWPFLPGIFESKIKVRSAWPPRSDPSKRIKSFFPVLAYFQWEEQKLDKFWVGQMETTLKAIRDVAKRTKVTTQDAPMYSNTCLETVKAKEVYQGGLDWLKKVRQRYDPKGVMNLTGGFKIPLK